MEIFYSYGSFDNIKDFLNPYNFHILDNRSDYYPERHDDPTWDGEHYKDEEGYLIAKSLYPTEVQIKDGPHFTYKINSHGFRSQHFKELNKEDINILYSGCSWTFGEGLPYEYLWTTLLTNKIKNYYPDKNVEEFNVGYMGYSIHMIFRNVMAFIRNYGKPDYIFLNLPDVARNINYCEVENKYKKVYYSKFHLQQRMDKTQLKYTKNFVVEDSILLAVDLINMLEDYCDSNNIKLIWTTWFNNELDMYEKLNFRHFMVTDRSFEKSRPFWSTTNYSYPYYPNPNNYPYWQIARDNSHPGTAWTMLSSHEFYTEFIKRHQEGGIWHEKNN